MNLRKRFIGGTAFALTLALSLTSVRVGTAVADDNINTEDKVEFEYFTAKLFDYKQSARDSETGEFYNGQYEADVALTVKTDEGLILFNQDNEKPKLGEKPGRHNSWEKNCKYKIFTGLANDEFVDGNFAVSDEYTVVSGNKIVSLFDEDSEEYVGSYNLPFEKGDNGYCIFDSSKNHLKVTDKLNENGNYDMERKEYASSVGFMPFNDALVGSSGSVYIPGEKNFYFGMKVAVPFVMTEDGKVETEDGQREDMLFQLSGDDDIWVFIDGKLVVDLGGVHDSVHGTINFATKEVTTVGNHRMEDGDFTTSRVGTDKDVKETVTMGSDVLNKLEKGAHTITIFYLERGGSVSNCKMTFLLESEMPEEPEETPQEPGEIPQEPGETPQEPGEVPQEPEKTPEEPVIPQETKNPTPVVTEDVVPEKKPEATKTPEKTPVEPQPTAPVVIIDDEEIPLADGEVPSDSDGYVDSQGEVLPQTGTESAVVFYAIGMVLMLAGFGMVRYARKSI